MGKLKLSDEQKIKIKLKILENKIVRIEFLLHKLMKKTGIDELEEMKKLFKGE